MYVHELSVRDFIRQYPALVSLIPYYIDRKDPFYRVRFTIDLQYLEIGYPTDEWMLEKDDNE